MSKAVEQAEDRVAQARATFDRAAKALEDAQRSLQIILAEASTAERGKSE